AVEADELRRDLANRLARSAFRLGPVGPAQAVQRRVVVTDVLGDLVERIRRYVKAITRLSALGRRVLDDQVLTLTAVYATAHHLDIPAHAVLFVDDEVTRLKQDRVDRVAPPARHARRVTRERTTLAGQVGFGEEREPEVGRDHAAAQASRRHEDDAGRKACVQARWYVSCGQSLAGALGGAVPVEDERDLPVVPGPLLEVCHGGLGAAAV